MSRAAGAGVGSEANLDLTVARILTIGSYVSIAFLVVGTALMALDGRSPLDAPAHGFDPSTMVADLAAGRPDGVLWLGILVLLLTPASRVGASLVGYLRSEERSMAMVSAAILGVIAVGVAIGVLLGIPTAS